MASAVVPTLVGGMPVIGILEVPRLSMSVVVLEGDDAAALSVGVGHMPDTPLPWDEGNTAFAGHRDSFFRPLRNLRVGDAIRLATRQGTFNYRVRRIVIVDTDDVEVLHPGDDATLTLITCYPFNFIGTAPKRFVVHAGPDDQRQIVRSDPPSTSADGSGRGQATRAAIPNDLPPPAPSR